MIYVFNCNWIDTRWQQYSTHLHTNNTQNTENGKYITIKKLNIHNNKKLTHLVEYTLLQHFYVRKINIPASNMFLCDQNPGKLRVSLCLGTAVGIPIGEHIW
jgi:hypothetical protein